MISYQFLIDAQLRPDKTPDFSAYPFCLPAVRHLGRLEFDPAVTFIVGENGSGKSTLLEGLAVALGFNAEGGSKNFNFGTRDSHSCLHEYLRVGRGVRKPRDGYFLRAESYFNVATEIERLDEGGGGPPVIDSYGGVSLHEQSHGESFLALLEAKASTSWTNRKPRCRRNASCAP
jgi:predicted ATPase